MTHPQGPAGPSPGGPGGSGPPRNRAAVIIDAIDDHVRSIVDRLPSPEPPVLTRVAEVFRRGAPRPPKIDTELPATSPGR